MNLATKLQEAFLPWNIKVEDSFGTTVLKIHPSQVYDVSKRLKDEFAFDLFLDVTAVDYPERANRFDVIHHFYSTKMKCRVRLKCEVSEATPEVSSLIFLFGSANYMERECHDMYGIKFLGNSDLRPILLYEGFVGHPLRKDYPIDKEQPIVEYRK